MKEEIFNYLKDYGFLKEDIYNFQDINDFLYFTALSLVTTNLKYLEDKDLSKEEIINIIKNNPHLLTIGSNKKEMLDNIYNDIFTKEELKKLIIKYPNTYNINPLELQSKITELKNNNKEIISKKIIEIISSKH